MGPQLTMEQRQLARRLSAKGLSLRKIGGQVGCSHEVVRSVVRRDSKRPLRSQEWRPGPGRLTLADREEISLGIRGGQSFTAIAAGLGKSVSTVSREVAANGGRYDYRAWRAHQRARVQARRPKPFKLSEARGGLDPLRGAGSTTATLDRSPRPRRARRRTQHHLHLPRRAGDASPGRASVPARRRRPPHPPFIGQGLGAGLRDADNLAWKIAHVLTAHAGPDLLGTYQT
jgi:DNA-binding CsgD family transcriptional regulator